MMRTHSRVLAFSLLASLLASIASADNQIWLWIRSKEHGGLLPGTSLSFDRAAAANHKPTQLFYFGVEPHLAIRLGLTKGTKIGLIQLRLDSPPVKGIVEPISMVVLKDVIVQSSKTSGTGIREQTVFAVTAKTITIKEKNATTNKDWNGTDPPKEKQPAK